MPDWDHLLDINPHLPRHSAEADECPCPACAEIRPDPLLREMQAADDRETARELAWLRREGEIPNEQS